MRHLLQAAALAALSLGACAGWVGWGYVPCDPYYAPYCYDYYYATWDPTAAAAGDFDADGRLDLAVADGVEGSLWLARGQERGGFAEVPSSLLSIPTARATVAAIDADGDDVRDLLVLSDLPGRLTTYRGDGRGGFVLLATTRAAAPGLVRFAHGALDGDGLDDVVTLDEAGGLHVALATGTGEFADVGRGEWASALLGPDAASRLAGIHVALADFDGEPGVDLVVVDAERGLVALLPGNGDGSFDDATTIRFAPSGPVLAIAPVMSGAGYPAHLAVLTGDRDDPSALATLTVLRPSDGGLEVGPLTVGTVRALVPLDLDGDGLTDLLLVDPLGRTIRTLRARR